MLDSPAMLGVRIRSLPILGRQAQEPTGRLEGGAVTWFEWGAIACIFLLGGFLRFYALDLAQYRPDDVTVWQLLNDLARQPAILSRGMPASFGLANGPIHVYLLLPGLALSSGPMGTYFIVAGLNAISVVWFWGFVRSYWGGRIAIVASLLYAASPWAVIFSRRIWPNDLVAPFTILLVWALCELVRRGRLRDYLASFFWLAIVVQVYVVALTHLVGMVAALALAGRKLRPIPLAAGLVLFAVLVAPYTIGAFIPGLPSLLSLAGSSSSVPQFDHASLYFMLHIVSAEGYQAYANQAGLSLDASQGFPLVVSLLNEAMLVCGLTVGIFRGARSLRRQRTQSVIYLVPAALVVVPVVLLIRHGPPVYINYVLTAMPMHFLFVAVGLEWLRQLVTKMPGNRPQIAFIARSASVGAVVITILTYLVAAQTFFQSIRTYVPSSEYGLPLSTTLEVIDLTRALAPQYPIGSVFIASREERDEVIRRTLEIDLPSLSTFDLSDTFIAPPGPDKALYVYSSMDSQFGNEFHSRFADHVVATIDAPGSEIRYRFYEITAEAARAVLADAELNQLQVSFGDAARLDGFRLERQPEPGQPGSLLTSWTLLREDTGLSGVHRTSIKLADSDGSIVYETDVLFTDAVRWRAGTKLLRRFSLPAPTGLEPGAYSYQIGLFTATPTGYEDLPAVDIRGELVGNGVPVGRLVALPPPAPAPTHRLQASIGDSISLDGYDIREGECRDGRKVELALHWRAIAVPEQDYTVFVHVLGPNGEIVAQHDGQPALGRFPTSTWRSGTTIVDQHTLTIPSDVEATSFTVETGLYRLETGERLGGQDADARFPIQVTACKDYSNG